MRDQNSHWAVNAGATDPSVRAGIAKCCQWTHRNEAQNSSKHVAGITIGTLVHRSKRNHHHF